MDAAAVVVQHHMERSLSARGYSISTVITTVSSLSRAHTVGNRLLLLLLLLVRVIVIVANRPRQGEHTEEEHCLITTFLRDDEI